MSDNISPEVQQASKETEEVHVPVPSPEPSVVSGHPQTHYHSSQQLHLQPNQFPSPHFPHPYPHLGMNQFSGSFPSIVEHPYGVGYSFQGHMNAPVSPLEANLLSTSKVSKKKGKKSSTVQYSNPPRRLWTPAEDIALTKAYLYVSVNSIVGKDQTSERMWNRILVAWRENMGTYDESRKANGLSCRWGLIQAAVTKFHAAYEAIERAPKSGNNIVDA
ncbi:hypothetical protein MKW92_053547, partial [Papaver armeniacum]